MFIARLIVTMKIFQSLEFTAMAIPVMTIPATMNFPPTTKNRLR
jgi:hypothetical protein